MAYSHNPAPGAQAPQKYPFTGPAYQQYGEQSGWIYDPYTDTYRPDPRTQREVLENQGIKEPKPPGMLEQLGTIGAGAAIGTGASQLGEQLVTGMFSAPTAPTAATTSGAGVAAPAAPNVLGATSVGGSGTGVAGGGGAAQAAPSGFFGSFGGSMGAGGAAAGALGAAAYGAGMYNYGGRNVISGEGESEDYIDLAAQSNPFTAWINPVLDILGLGSLGDIFGHKSTKQRQKERRESLAKEDPTFAQILSIAKENEDQIKALQAQAAAETPDDFKGWHNVNGQQVWVNKLAPQEGFKHNDEYFQTLGSGDVIHNPWFFENIEGYGALPLEERIRIADAALQYGNPHGNAGDIDFDLTDELAAAIEGDQNDEPTGMLPPTPQPPPSDVQNLTTQQAPSAQYVNPNRLAESLNGQSPQMYGFLK